MSSFVRSGFISGLLSMILKSLNLDSNFSNSKQCQNDLIIDHNNNRFPKQFLNKMLAVCKFE